jgi:NAD(P)-dependent dehydrogenase (short-subunit alcohol dehydrogenase family)
MFNHAGIGSKLGPFLDVDLGDFRRVMGVNLYGMLLGCQYAGRHMKENGGGSIINNSSIAGIMGGGDVTIDRCAKAAVAHISKTIACDLDPFNIRVNAIAPGHTPTEITKYDMGPVIRFTQPFPRQGSVVDVANAVVYLASDLSAQVSGAMIPVGGGTAAGPSPDQMHQLLKKG